MNKELMAFPKDEFNVNIKNNHLLVIAIDNYLYCNKLYNAVRDAKNIIEILTSDYGFKDDEGFLTTLFNEEATRKNIYKELKKLQTVLAEDDNLIILFSGHGMYDDKYDGFWIPVEASLNEIDEYIDNSTIIKFIKNIKAKHILVISDSCFSGALFLENHRKLDNSRPDVVKLQKLKSRWGMSSGRLELVSDGEIGKNSPFATYLIKYLKDNDSKLFTTFDLFNYVRIATSRNSNQIPRAEPLKDVGDEGGEFVFYKIATTESELEKAKKIDTIEEYLNYLNDNPYSKNKEEVYEAIEKLEIEEKNLWIKATEVDSLSLYLRFLHKFPTGKFSELAKQKIEYLQKLYQRKESLPLSHKKPIEKNIQKGSDKTSNNIESDDKVLFPFPIPDHIDRSANESRYDIFKKIGESGTDKDVDYLMKTLAASDGFGISKLIDFVLGLVSKTSGIERIKYYLFKGSNIQRNYAALYFKRLGYVSILEEAVNEKVIDKIQAFSK